MHWKKAEFNKYIFANHQDVYFALNSLLYFSVFDLKPLKSISQLGTSN